MKQNMPEKLNEENEYFKRDNIIIDCSILLQRNKDGSFYFSVTNCNGDYDNIILVNQKINAEDLTKMKHKFIGQFHRLQVVNALDEIIHKLMTSSKIAELK